MGDPAGILILGGYRQSLAVVRDLGPLGWRSVLGLPILARQSYLASSRWISEVWPHPPLDVSVDAFLAALSQFVESRPDIRFLLPIGNFEIAALNPVRSRLPSKLQCLMPNAPAIQVCGDKSATLRLASELGFPLAPLKVVDEPGQLLDASDQLGYPCVIRATLETNPILGMKAFKADSHQDLAALLENADAKPQGPFIAQRYVDGDRHCLYFYASRGAVLALAQVQIARTNRADGTGNAVAGVSVAVSPDWENHVGRACSRLEYHGFGCLQYIAGRATGEQTFLEINARLGGNHAGLERLGMHQVRWAIEEFESGSPTIPTPFIYPEGVRYRWFYGDLMGLLSEGKAGRLSWRAAAAWCLALPTTLLGTGHLIWTWRDPAPAAQLALELGKLVCRKLRAATARATRKLVENPVATRRRRRDTLQRLLMAADRAGTKPESLTRVYDYVSVVTKVHPPRYVHSNQRPSRYFPGLAARPYHDPAAFPWRSLLEDNFVVIREEVMAARAATRFKPHHQKLADQGNWDTLYFYSGNRRIDQGHALCPKTAEILSDIPRAGNNGQVYISVLSGRTHIEPHCGPTNVRLRCHFGIDVPDGSRIRVGSKIVSWQEGRCLFFDDSFQHEVWNFSEEERVILIVDVWHPDLTTEERWAIEHISQEAEAIKRYQRSVTA